MRPEYTNDFEDRAQQFAQVIRGFIYEGESIRVGVVVDSEMIARCYDDLAQGVEIAGGDFDRGAERVDRENTAKRRDQVYISIVAPDGYQMEVAGLASAINAEAQNFSGRLKKSGIIEKRLTPSAIRAAQEGLIGLDAEQMELNCELVYVFSGNGIELD